MKNSTLNLRDLVILVADPSPYMCMLANSMLRGFGANKAMDARSSIDATCSAMRPRPGLTRQVADIMC